MAGIIVAVCYSRKQKFGGTGQSLSSEIRPLRQSNQRLNKIVTQLELDKPTLRGGWIFKAQGVSAKQLRRAIVHTRLKLASLERRTCRVIVLNRSNLQ